MIFLQLEMMKGQDAKSTDVFLIAHRGGVVEHNAENSRAAMLAAIDRGYWMLEVDIRETRDGRAILQHDADFRRFYEDPGRVSEMDWHEIKKLQSYIDAHRPILFSEAADIIVGRTKLMLDVKGNDHSEGFYREIEEALNRHDLIETTYILGSAQAKEYFHDRTKHSIDFDGMVKAGSAGEDVSNRYYLFMLASQLTEEMIQKANELNVVVVAAVNEFRYEEAGENKWIEAKMDVERLLDLGVNYFQIDSVYEPLLIK